MKAFIINSYKIISLPNYRHLDYIKQNPKVFGFKDGEIESIYKKNNEDLSSYDCKSAEEIYKIIADNGWIRVRDIDNYRDSKGNYKNGWGMLGYNFSNDKSSIINFLNDSILKGYGKMNDVILYFEIGKKGGVSKEYIAEDLLNESYEYTFKGILIETFKRI